MSLDKTVSDAEVVGENEKPQAKEYTEEQMALLSHHDFLQRFAKKLNEFEGSKTQVINAWFNAAVSPLNKEELHFSYPEQKELFDLFNELNSAKTILIIHGLAREGRLTLNQPLINTQESKGSEDEQQEK